jgi:quercetin dioxygenase-like cupin family protein
VVVQVGEEEALLVSGMAALAPAGEVHGVRNASASPALLLVVMAPKP